MLVREFKKKTVIKPEPPYSLGLAPANFFRFSKLTKKLLAISKRAFHKCSEDWKYLIKSVLYLRGVTLKGDKIIISLYKNDGYLRDR